MLGTPEKKLTKAGCTEGGALMTSQLCHYFQATQAVHGADGIINLHLQSQVISLSVCGLQVDTLIY